MLIYDLYIDVIKCSRGCTGGGIEGLDQIFVARIKAKRVNQNIPEEVERKNTSLVQLSVHPISAERVISGK